MKSLRITPEERGIYTAAISVVPPRASGPLSAAAKAAWIVIRDEGGYWNATELGLRMQPGLPPAKAGMSGGRWLNALSARGHVHLNPHSLRVNSYGVTARCIPLPGHSLQPATPTTPKGTL